MSQALSTPNLVFTKYPDLPTEIRLMIIEEAIEASRRGNIAKSHRSCTYHWHLPFLFPLSSVDHEWNREVEMLLFRNITLTPQCLPGFAKICGKRHGRLHKINLYFYEGDVPFGVKYDDYVGRTLARLFNIMKDWSHVNRDRHGLIEVRLGFCNVWIHSQSDPNIYGNRDVLPQVSIIGALDEVPHDGTLHPSTSLRLYESLPNLRRAYLNLPFRDDTKTSIERAKGKSTRDLPCCIPKADRNDIRVLR